MPNTNFFNFIKLSIKETTTEKLFFATVNIGLYKSSLCTLINCVTHRWRDYLIYRCFVNCQLNKSVTDRRMDNLRERLTNRRFIIIDRLCIWVISHWLLSYLYKMNLKCLCVIKCSCIKASEIDQLVLLFSLCHE